MTTAITRAEAAFQEQVHAQWRDWCAYLRAHLALLATETVAQAAFERTDPDGDRGAAARRALAALPAAARALFDEVREARRQEAQRTAEARQASERTRLVDPDTVERSVLHLLLAEAEGTAEGPDRAPEWGDVPLRVDGAVQWYRVNVRALTDAPSAAAYTVGASGTDDIRRRIVLAVALVASTIVFLIAWFLWPRGVPTRLEEARVATVNGAPVAVWPVQSLVLVAATGEERLIPVSPTEGSRSPLVTEQRDATTRAFWRVDTFAPLTLCVPEELLAGAAGLRLRSRGDVPERVYMLTETTPAAPDLVLAACESTVAATFRFGMLQATTAPEPLVPGTAATLPDGTAMTVAAIHIIGPGQDPTLPPGQARVIVIVQSLPRDWPADAPTLLLASGEALAAPEQVATPDGVELRYLVPLPAAPLDAAWSITPAGASDVLRWRTTLTPPPDRTSVVRTALDARDVTVVRENNGLALRLTLVNRSADPLALTPDDLTLLRNDTTLPPLDLAALRAPLAPGEARQVTLPLPDAARTTRLVLRAGAQQYQIAP
jgi:hypothetical protein